MAGEIHSRRPMGVRAVSKRMQLRVWAETVIGLHRVAGRGSPLQMLYHNAVSL